MSGATSMGRIGTPKEMPGIDRNPSTFQPGRHAASLAASSDTGLQNADETFRRGWNAIVLAFQAFDKGNAERVPAEDSRRKACTADSVHELAGVAEIKGWADTDPSARATSKLALAGASTADSVAPRLQIVLGDLSGRDATPTDPGHLPPTVRGENFDLHFSKFSRKSGQSAKEQGTAVQDSTIPASYPSLMIYQPVALQPGILLIPENKLRPSFFASESLKQQASSESHQHPDALGSVAGAVPISVTGLRQASAAPTQVMSEVDTARDSVSPHLSPMGASQEPHRTNELDLLQKPEAGAEQAKAPVPEEQPIRPSVIDPQPTIAARDTSIEPGYTQTSAQDRGSEIAQQHPADPRNQPDMRRDRTGISKVQSSSPARTASASSVQNQPVSDARYGAFEEMRGCLVPGVSVVAFTSSPSLDPTRATSVKTVPVHETFTAMDAGMSDGAVSWVRADSHRAEAGFQDPSLGWVSVRAQAGAAGIHASIMPSSEAAAEVLSGHLASLNAHMANHYEHLNAVTLSTPGHGQNSDETHRELNQGNGGPSDHGRQQQMQEKSTAIPSGPVREFASDHPEEGTNTGAPVFTAGMNTRDHHISVVV